MNLQEANFSWTYASPDTLDLLGPSCLRNPDPAQCGKPTALGTPFLPQKTVVCLRSSYPLYSFDEIGFLGRTTASPPWLRSAIFAVFVICWVGHTLPWMPDAAGWAQLLLESWSWHRGLMPGSVATGEATSASLHAALPLNVPEPACCEPQGRSTIRFACLAG